MPGTDIGACPHGTYILVMLKLVGFIGISLLASKYLLSIHSGQALGISIANQTEMVHSVVEPAIQQKKADLVKSLHVTIIKL